MMDCGGLWMDDRYSRQVLFRPIGREGQQRLAAARVVIVGMGALGTVLATQLVRAGVGFLRLVDRDIIEPSNLQRQTLYDEEDAELGRAKAEAAAQKLQAANRDVQIEAVIEDLTWRNAKKWLADVDVIVDGTDNFQVRYLMNDVAVQHGIPWSYGGAVSSYGTTAFFRPLQTACLTCLFGSDGDVGGHDTCDTVGVIAPVVAIIASLQVAEILKYLTGNLAALSNALMHVNVWDNEFRSVQLSPPKTDCPCCQLRQFQSLAARTDGLTVSLCGRRTIQVRPESSLQVSLEAMAERLSRLGQVRHNAHLLRCDFGDVQLTLFADGRALIHGVDDSAKARSLYARYVGM